MRQKSIMSLDPSALSAFAATLTNLPREEIGKAKRLYILNAMAEFEAMRTSGRAMMIVMGLMCIIPIFLIVFIPGYFSYRSAIKATRQKILNAVEVWRDDLGDDYAELHEKAMQ